MPTFVWTHAPASVRPDWVSWERALIAHGYTVRKLLGAGGFGRAYRCEDRSGAEKVVKVSLDPATGPLMLQEEYQFMSELRHPNLPHVYQGSQNTTISRMLPPSQKHI
jgi:serine/threonine protein kinase